MVHYSYSASIASSYTKMAEIKRVATFYLVLKLLCNFTEADSVSVSPQCPGNTTNCLDLDAALVILSSGMTFHLLPGRHTIQENQTSYTQGASNVTIIGSGNEETLINCGEGTGLISVHWCSN